MPHYSASPRLGHIEGFYHMFEYLRKHGMSRMVFDTFQQKVDDIALALETTY